jgi:hypothetical protein
MTFIDRDKKICFISIAKNGGNSIHAALKKNFKGLEGGVQVGLTGIWYARPGHMVYQHAKTAFPAASKSWFSFAVIREPTSRCLSAFYWLNRNRRHLTQNDLDRFVEELEKEANQEFWQKEAPWPRYSSAGTNQAATHPHLVPQTFYFDDPSEIYLFKFEDMSTGMKRIEREFNITIELPHLNRGPEKDLFFSKRQISLLGEIYKDDFNLHDKVGNL